MDFDRSNIKLVIVLLLVAALICGGIVFYGIRKKDNSIIESVSNLIPFRILVI